MHELQEADPAGAAETISRITILELSNQSKVS